jgi:hypothetical protein
MYIAIYFATRLCVKASWKNDRDQFLAPKDGWQFDKDFQSDCLAFMLFHGQNRISAKYNINHWIPFTEEELQPTDNFQSHFMSDFINGKIPAAQLSDMYLGQAIIPNEPIQFTPAATKVMEIGREIWCYYLHHNDDSNQLYGDEINVNASLYDIREYFQGRDEKGKMNNKSEDETYNELMSDLRAAQDVLAKQIEKKVYMYGFLKGEINPTERLHELERQNAELRHQLQAAKTEHAVNIHIYESGAVHDDNSTNISLNPRN